MPSVNPGEERLLKRSVELKIELLTEVFGWHLLVVDQVEFMSLSSEEKEKSLLEKLKPLSDAYKQLKQQQKKHSRSVA